jgi:DNA-binding CsgD family transcriptional regulator
VVSTGEGLEGEGDLAEVAEKLFISCRTVNWNLGSVYRKLGFSSRTEATRFAVEHDLH